MIGIVIGILGGAIITSLAYLLANSDEEEEKIECPRCKSKNICIFNPETNKYIYVCKDCKTIFYL